MRNGFVRAEILLTVAFLVFLPCTHASAISCPAPEFTSADQIQINGSAVILVTNATMKFDLRRTIESGLDATIRFADQNGVPFVYLHDKDDNPATYFYPSCTPTYWYNSGSGDFRFTFDATHVISLGGFSEACQGLTVGHISRVWSQSRFGDKDLRLSLVTDGIYSFDLLWISKNDPFYPEYKMWKESLPTQGDVSVQEIRELIRQTTADVRAWEAVVLKRWFDLTLRDLPKTHRIVFAIDSSPVEVIREGTSKEAATLTIDFVNSTLLKL